MDKPLFPNGLFPPSPGDRAQRFTGVRTDEALPEGIRAVAMDSDPFYCLALFVDGQPAAVEYTGDYQERIDEIAANPLPYRIALKLFMDSNR